MAHIGQLHLGKWARAVAIALVLGAGAPAFPTGHAVAHAASIVTVAGDAEAGGQDGPTDEARKPRPKNNGVGCTFRNDDGSVDTYKTGDTMSINGIKLKCGKDGKWHQVRFAPTWVPRAPSGGVFAPG